MLWKNRFSKFLIGLMMILGTIGVTNTVVYANVGPEAGLENVVIETTIQVETVEETVGEVEDEAVDETAEETFLEVATEPEVEVVIEETLEVEEINLAALLSEAQTSATKAIDEDDSQAITFIEELEDGTRIYEFRNKLFTIPSNLLQREPLVSESGYVEKITYVPHYLQQSYPYTDYGVHGTVSSHGCGIASCAMVYSYLLDREIRPDELAEQYGRYNTEHGSDYELFSASAKDYGLEVTMSHCWSEVEDALRNGCIVIALVKSNTIFTSGGHYIVYYGITEDNKILVNDPNIYNFGEWSSNALKTGFREGFEMKYCKYSVPCWIYAPKDIETIAARAEG